MRKRTRNPKYQVRKLWKNAHMDLKTVKILCELLKSEVHDEICMRVNRDGRITIMTIKPWRT